MTIIVAALVVISLVLFWIAYNMETKSAPAGSTPTPLAVRHSEADPEMYAEARLRASLDVYFSPDGGCEEAICHEICCADYEIHTMSYYMTSKPIIDALLAAKARGVVIRMITDDVGDNSEYLQPLLAKVDQHWVDKRHKIMHNKVMIIDDRVVITGSFNFTASAEDHNAENLLVIRSKAMADRYLGNWQTHRHHSDLIQRGV